MEYRETELSSGGTALGRRIRASGVQGGRNALDEWRGAIYLGSAATYESYVLATVTTLISRAEVN
jgi:hypothetical protein